MAWVELTDKRTKKAKHFFDATTGLYRAEITIHDQHYFVAGQGWNDVDETIVDDTSKSGYVAKADKQQHAVYFGNAAERQWYPRRDVPTEYVIIGRPEYWDTAGQGRWRQIPVAALAKAGNVASWDLANIKITLTNTWDRIKAEFTLKDSTAPTRLRFPATFVGLAYNSTTGELTSTTDGQVWGTIDPPTAWYGATEMGAVGSVALPTSSIYDGTYVEWSVTTAGATYPVYVDPTLTDGYGSTPNTAKDSYVDSGNATTNYGTSNYIAIVNGGTRTGCTGLIGFDLSSITAGSTCTSATVYTYKHLITGSFVFGYYEMVSANASAWTEAGCTWNTRNGTNAWSGGSSGCHTSGTDYNATSLGSYSVANADAAGKEYTCSLTAATIANHFGGALELVTLSPSGDEWTSGWVSSSDHATTGVRPKLVVVYSSTGSSSVSPSVSPSLSPSSSVSPSVSPSSSASPSTSPSISPSVSPSVSPSASASPSFEISGSTCWGHVTGVTESNIRTFANHWTGTGSYSGSGDGEQIELNSTEYMESEVVSTGAMTVQLLLNNYSVGDTVTLKYRHGTSPANCLAASWVTYSTPFSSLGYVQVRLEATI